MMRQYQSFDSEESALPLVEALQAAGLEFEIEKARNYIDAVFVGDFVSKMQIVVKLDQSDFSRADKVVEDAAKRWIELAPDDHYLFSFSDAELLSILKNKPEWSLGDYFLAKNILIDREIVVAEEVLKAEDEQRLHESRKPQKASLTLLLAGYLIPLLGAGMLPVFYLSAFVIGGFLILSRKTDRTGRRFYFFDSQSRKHGLAMIVLWAIISLTLFFFIATDFPILDRL